MKRQEYNAMATNEKVKVSDQAKLGDMTVGQFKALVRTLMHQQMIELLEDFENYLPDPETGWTVQPEVWAQVRAFLRRETGEPE